MVKLFNRQKEIDRLQRILLRLHSPQLHMALIVALAAATAFLSSYLFLLLGMDKMWMRYGLTIAIAYGVFLFFLWVWLKVHREGIEEHIEMPDPSFPSGGDSFSSHSGGTSDV